MFLLPPFIVALTNIPVVLKFDSAYMNLVYSVYRMKTSGTGDDHCYHCLGESSLAISLRV